MPDVGLRCRIDSLDLDVRIGFPSRPQAVTALGLVEDRVSGARLPRTTWTVADASGAAVQVNLVDDGDDLLVAYQGAVTCAPYRVDKLGFHWDFTRVVTAIGFTRILERGIVPVHGACLELDGGPRALLPGASGAGKSSLAFAALARGCAVLGSELAFIRDGQLIAANTMATIDARALDLLQIPVAPEAAEKGGRIVLPTSPIPAAATIDRVVFPKVTTGRLNRRRITSRRARMLLFQNIINELPVSQLIAHETTPLGGALTDAHLATVADQVGQLSVLEPEILEGRPADILDALEDGA